LRYFPQYSHRDSFGGKIKNFRAISKKLFLFGLPVLVTDVGHKVISYIDTLVLTYFRPLSDVGVYNVVLPSAMALLFISTSISAVVFPVFAELWAKKDKQKLRDGLRLLHTYVFIAVAPIVFTLLAFSDLFIKLFFGKEYVAGAMALQILLVGVLFFVVSGINHSVISSIGYPKTVTKIVLAAAVVNAGVNFLLIPTYGIEGAAIATTLSYALALGLSTYASTRYIKTSLPVVRWLKTGVAALFFAGTVYFVKSVISLNPYTEAVIALGVAAVVYLGAIFFFKLVDIKELRFYGSLVFQKKGF
jgi:stage V sporulation protein B